MSRKTLLIWFNSINIHDNLMYNNIVEQTMTHCTICGQIINDDQVDENDVCVSCQEAAEDFDTLESIQVGDRDFDYRSNFY